MLREWRRRELLERLDETAIWPTTLCASTLRRQSIPGLLGSEPRGAGGGRGQAPPGSDRGASSAPLEAPYHAAVGARLAELGNGCLVLPRAGCKLEGTRPLAASANPLAHGHRRPDAHGDLTDSFRPQLKSPILNEGRGVRTTLKEVPHAYQVTGRAALVARASGWRP